VHHAALVAQRAPRGGGARDVSLGRLKKAIEVGGESAPPTLRQADHIPPVRLGEVVDVDPVGRCGPARSELAQNVMNGAFAARSGRAGDEEVVTGRVDLQAECDRVDCAGLPDCTLKWGHAGGARGQLSGVDAAPELFRRDRELRTESLCHI